MKVRQYQPLMVLALVMACSEGSEPTAAPGRSSGSMSAIDHMSAAVTTTAAAAPFTVRATLEPFRISQPDFTIQSKTRSDIVIQQSVFTPGAGMWHTHPGPSFIYVLEGEIKLEKYTKDFGCRETPVYGPGQAYFEEGNQVHRAVVLSATNAVVLVTRFNIPVGQPFTIPAADPGC